MSTTQASATTYNPPEGPMTGRQRLRAALRGEAVDRAPIWLREGFDVVQGPASAEHFERGWQADPLYRDLLNHVAPWCDDLLGWHLPGPNRFLAVPSKFIRHDSTDRGDVIETRTTVTTPRGPLVQVSQSRRNVATSWITNHLVESMDELKMLADVPFEVDPAQTRQGLANYRHAAETVGERGLPRLFLSSPIVCISGAMSFEMFLEMSAADGDWVHELCEMVMERQLAMIDPLLAAGPLDTVLTLGGSEQCTPPMMDPRMYDEYVVSYDGPIVERFRGHGCLTTMHCHGRVRHALRGMLEMGIDGTDPVEPPPAGDVTFAEAREICGERLTIMGNFEWDELEFAEPQHIRQRVREMLAHGPKRLIMAASAGPISAVTPRLAANYRAWIDTVLELSQ